MRPRTSLALLSFFSLLLLISPGARAQGPSVDPVETPTASDPLDRRAWATEVRAMRAAEKLDLAPLVRAAREAAPGSHAQAQRALEDAKREWRRRVLGAQLARVRAAGLVPHAQRIEQRIAELDAVRDRRPVSAPVGGEQ